MKKLIKIILIITIFGFTFFLGKIFIAKYDHHINSKKRSKMFIENLNEQNLDDIYSMFNKSYSEIVSKDSLNVLISPIFNSNKIAETTISRIQSNDIFTIDVISDVNTLTFTFGDGWGKGWKIKHILIK